MPNTIQIVRLAPHDPIPAGPGRHVTVLHRMDEDRPQETVTIISLTGPEAQSTRPMRPDGRAMTLDEAIEAARRVAEGERIDRVYVVDRTAGEREREILQHAGDHTIGMDDLVDSDGVDGERGTDMRDRTP